MERNRNPPRISCSATAKSGAACRAFAVRDTNPPLCSAHSGRNTGAGAPKGNKNARTHGLYSRHHTIEEIDDIIDLINAAADGSLEEEIANSRIIVGRLTKALADSDIQPLEYAKLAMAAFSGMNSVARMLRDKRVLSGEAANGVSEAMARVVEELSAEWDTNIFWKA